MIIDGFFCSGIAQVVPLLEEVDLEKVKGQYANVPYVFVGMRA